MGLWLATAAVAAPPSLPQEPTDQIDVDRHEDALELSWSDAEDRLKGSIRPNVPRAGQPLQVSLEVGSFEGEDFDGPLILTLREVGANHGQSVTVARGDRHWETTFTPEHEGPYLLDVTFRTTRHKSLHAPFEVSPSLVPRMLLWGALGLGCLLAVGYTVRNLLKGDRPEERALPASADAPAAPGETPPTPAAEASVAATSTSPGTEAPPTGEPPAAISAPPPGAEPSASHSVEAGEAPAPSAPAEAENKPPADP
jgi:hypothetical protein